MSELKEQFQLNKQLDAAWSQGAYEGIQFVIAQFLAPIAEIITSVSYQELYESAVNTISDKFDKAHKR